VPRCKKEKRIETSLTKHNIDLLKIQQQQQQQQQQQIDAGDASLLMGSIN
jgi:hypothetical protein